MSHYVPQNNLAAKLGPKTGPRFCIKILVKVSRLTTSPRLDLAFHRFSLIAKAITPCKPLIINRAVAIQYQ